MSSVTTTNVISIVTAASTLSLGIAGVYWKISEIKKSDLDKRVCNMYNAPNIGVVEMKGKGDMHLRHTVRLDGHTCTNIKNIHIRQTY